MKLFDRIRPLLIPAVLFAVLLTLAGCNGDKPKIGTIAPPSGTPKAPQGLKALAVTAGPTPFSQADVGAYLQTNSLPRNFGPRASVRVDNLEFITSADVTTRLQGVRSGLADSARIGFATLSGDFTFTGPSGTRPARFGSAYAAFDATTGNLLMMGTLASPDATNGKGTEVAKPRL